MARVGVESDEEQEEVGQHRHGSKEQSRIPCDSTERM